MPDALCGKMCENKLNESEALKCSLCCVLFHNECVNVQKALATPMKKWPTPNVQFRCDNCLSNDKNLMKMIEKIMTTLIAKNDTKNEDRFNKIMSKIDHIENSLDISEKKVVDEITKAAEEGKSFKAPWTTVVKQGKKKPDPVVVITPTDKLQDRKKTIQSIKNAIDPTAFAVQGINNASNNGVVVRCLNDDGRDKFLDEASQKLSENYEVKKPTKRLPRFKILRVNDPEVEDLKFITKLKQQNPTIADDKCKFEIIKREQVKVRGVDIASCFNIVIQTDGETFSKVMKNDRILVGYERFKVVDNVYVRRCWNCYGFNHIASNCNLTQKVCSSCSLFHEKSTCTETIEKCINCVQFNKKHGLSIDVQHNVWSRDCQVYKKKLIVSKRAISYVE